MNEVTATPSVSRVRNRFTAYSAGPEFALIWEGYVVLGRLAQRLNNIKPLWDKATINSAT